MRNGMCKVSGHEAHRKQKNMRALAQRCAHFGWLQCHASSWEHKSLARWLADVCHMAAGWPVHNFETQKKTRLVRKVTEQSTEGRHKAG